MIPIDVDAGSLMTGSAARALPLDRAVIRRNMAVRDARLFFINKTEFVYYFFANT
jgi:hypothetical protein